jgi:hypothetical protein
LVIDGDVMTKRWTFVVLCSAVLFAPLRAAAADTDPKAVTEAQERFREGNRLFDQGNYEGARVAYDQSLAIVPHGSTYRNLARAEMKLGDALGALRHLRMALKDPELDAKRRVITKREFDEAYAATGHLAVTTSLGASMMVDGGAVDGTAPFADAIDVTVGKHTLEAHLGSQSAKVDVDAKGGQVSSIDIALPPPGPPPAASVTNGAAPSPAPAMTTMPDVPPPERAPSFWTVRREVGLGVAAVGLAALGTSVYFYTDGNSQRDRANALAAGLPTGACGGSSPATGCSDMQNARNAQSNDVTLRSVFIGGGAAAVLVGAGLFFWPTSNHSQTAITPFFTPQQAGLLLRGEL